MEKPIYFRRCHCCGHLNHQEIKRVDRCLHCGKHLSRFYYFDDRIVTTPSDHLMRPSLFDTEYIPIQGLTAYWEIF